MFLLLHTRLKLPSFLRDISDRCNFSTTRLEEKSKSKSVLAKVIDELYSKDVKIASRIPKN